MHERRRGPRGRLTAFVSKEGNAMKLNVLFLSLALCGMSGALLAQESQDPLDMQEYIHQIRAMGMTEYAQMTLHTMADIRVGATEIYFVRDSTGFYGMGYRSLACSNPAVDAATAQAMKQEWSRKMEPEIACLRGLADADSSGFVSSAEATSLRRLVEFGYKAAHVASAEDNDILILCRAVNSKEEDVRFLLEDYAKLQEKAKRGRIEPFPEVAVR
jgi:hypothetical protein